MASTRLGNNPKATLLEDFGREVERRREAAGQPELPRNGGKRRTTSKRALLKAIEATGAKW